MIGSDSQAMGRVGETIVRTWQTAHVMAAKRGGVGQRAAASATSPSTRSARRSRTGSRTRSARSRSASSPTSCSGTRAYFAIRPRLVIKGGAIAYAPMGDANASIPTPQPVLMRPMFAGAGRLAARRSLTFVSPLALETLGDLGLESRLVAVEGHALGAQGRHAAQRRAARRSASSPTRSRSGSTATRSCRTRSPSCRSRSATRCSAMDPLALLLADSRFPSGSYAHSLGLEQAVERRA